MHQAAGATVTGEQRFDVGGRHAGGIGQGVAPDQGFGASFSSAEIEGRARRGGDGHSPNCADLIRCGFAPVDDDPRASGFGTDQLWWCGGTEPRVPVQRSRGRARQSRVAIGEQPRRLRQDDRCQPGVGGDVDVSKEPSVPGAQCPAGDQPGGQCLGAEKGSGVAVHRRSQPMQADVASSDLDP